MHTNFSVSVYSYSMLFRRICTSLSHCSGNPLIFSRNYADPFAVFDSISQNLSPNSFNLRFLRSSFVYNRFCSSTRKMGGGRRPAATPIPELDKANRAELYRALEAAVGSPFSSKPLVQNPSPSVIVISGPSGVGKDAVIKRLREVRKNIHFVVTATSRDMRPGEIHGKDYFFVSKEEFLSMVERQELLEYALVYGDYKGIPKQQVRDYMAEGCDIVLRVDIQGAAKLRRVFRDSAVFIFILPESESMLVQRLIARKTETKETLLVRIATAREEVKQVNRFDYVVVNVEGELERSVKLVESIIDAEKARVQQRRAAV